MKEKLNTIIENFDRNLLLIDPNKYTEGTVRIMKEKLTTSVCTSALYLAAEVAGVDVTRFRVEEAVKYFFNFNEETNFNYLIELEERGHSIQAEYIIDNIDAIQAPIEFDAIAYYRDNEENDVPILMGENKTWSDFTMFRRFVFDCTAITKSFPTVEPFLFQLQSALVGDYHGPYSEIKGGDGVHALLLHFYGSPVEIFTILTKKRKSKSAIHMKDHRQTIDINRLTEIVMDMASMIKRQTNKLSFMKKINK